MLNLALIAYVVATGLALAYLVQREEVTYRLTTAVTLAGWALQTAGLIARTVEGGRGPFSSFPEAVSVAVWAAVLLELWAERQYRIRVLGAFVLPVVVVLSVSGTMARPAGGLLRDPRLRGARAHPRGRRPAAGAPRLLRAHRHGHLRLPPPRQALSRARFGRAPRGG